MNRKDRRAWNRMVTDAREVRSEIVLDEDTGETISCPIPDADTLTELASKQAQGDLYGALGILFGEDNVVKLRESAKSAAGDDGRVPITVWRELMNSVMEDLGLGGPPER